MFPSSRTHASHLTITLYNTRPNSVGSQTLWPERRFSPPYRLHCQWRSQEHFSGGGVQQIQFMTESRENGDLGAVTPLSGVPLNFQMSETHIMIRLSRMYFPRSWELPPPPSVRQCYTVLLLLTTNVSSSTSNNMATIVLFNCTIIRCLTWCCPLQWRKVRSI
jgi:hypothetical protein